MKNPYNHTLSEALGVCPEERASIERIILRILELQREDTESLARMEMAKREVENEENKPRKRKKAVVQPYVL
jgi:hypothetical protein